MLRFSHMPLVSRGAVTRLQSPHAGAIRTHLKMQKVLRIPIDATGAYLPMSLWNVIEHSEKMRRGNERSLDLDSGSMGSTGELSPNKSSISESNSPSQTLRRAFLREPGAGLGTALGTVAILSRGGQVEEVVRTATSFLSQR